MRFGIAGVGKMGQNHLRELQKNKNVELVALYDLQKNEDFKEPFYTRISEFLKQKLDIVIIASPTSSHLELANAILPKVQTVLIEKPLAMNLEEIKQIKKLATKHKNKIAVGFSERFNPVVLSLKKALQGQRIFSINIRRYSPFPIRISDVGILRDLGIHDIDLVGFLTGLKFARKSLINIKQNNQDIEAIITLESLIGLDLADFKKEQNEGLDLKSKQGLTKNQNSKELDSLKKSKPLETKNLQNSQETQLSSKCSTNSSHKIIASLHQSWNCSQVSRRISVITEKSFFEANLRDFKLYKDGVLSELENKSPLSGEHKELLELARSGKQGRLAGIEDAINAQECLELG